MELSETRICQFADRSLDVRLLEESGNFRLDQSSKGGIHQLGTRERYNWQFQRLSSGE